MTKPGARLPSSPTALVLHPQLLGGKALQHLLRRLGVGRVLHAQDWPQALQVLGAEPVQLVLTPWSLPGLEGPALLRALRSRGRGRAPKLILLDDGLPRQTIVAAVKHGIAGRVTLPATLDALREAIQQAEPDAGEAAPPTAPAEPDLSPSAIPRRAPAID